MSTTEVVKKRGRPKKVVSDSISVEKLEPVKKSTTRQKSTKTSSEALAATTQTKTTRTTKAPSTKNVAPPEKPVPKTASKAATTTSTKTSSSTLTKPSLPPQTSDSAPTVAVTPENSKILSKVRELEEKPAVKLETTAPTPKTPSGSINVTTEATEPLQTSPQVQKATATPELTSLPPKSSQSKATSPSPSASISKAPAPTSTTNNSSSLKDPPSPAKPRVPIAELNSNIVSQLTSRSGARPSPKLKQQLPPGYSSVARKVTLTMIAFPIAIVTSYVLYQRLVLGVDRKHLVRPGLVRVDQVESEKGGED